MNLLTSVDSIKSLNRRYKDYILNILSLHKKIFFYLRAIARSREIEGDPGWPHPIPELAVESLKSAFTVMLWRKSTNTGVSKG